MRIQASILAGAALMAAIGLSACGETAKPAGESPAVTPAAEPAKAKTQSPLEEIETPGAARDSATPFRSDTNDIFVAAAGTPGDRLEFKLRMKAGDTLTYAWKAEDAANLWHEFHGHTAEKVAFYKKADGAAHRGVLVAPFDGIHGWYFENRAPEAVIVRLQTGGFYELVRDAAD